MELYCYIVWAISIIDYESRKVVIWVYTCVTEPLIPNLGLQRPVRSTDASLYTGTSLDFVPLDTNIVIENCANRIKYIWFENSH